MKALRMACVSALGVLSAVTVHAQESAEKPPGAVVSGNTWCVFVNGKYNAFLAEVARAVDLGAEVQGGFVYDESNGTYTALVCKRNRKD